jgi:hypothetical protein
VKDSQGRRKEESEWKRKLRNKLVKGKGNEEVLRGSMMVDVVEETEEKEWKRKLRERLRKSGGREEALASSFLA